MICQMTEGKKIFMERLKLFYLNSYAVKAHNLQEAIQIVQSISSTWQYQYCSKVDLIS